MLRLLIKSELSGRVVRMELQGVLVPAAATLLVALVEVIVQQEAPQADTSVAVAELEMQVTRELEAVLEPTLQLEATAMVLVPGTTTEVEVTPLLGD